MCSDHTLLANLGQRDSTRSGRNSQMKKITVATWNVRTMLGRDNRPEHRTALIVRELQLFGMETAALQETGFEAQGQFQEEEYAFF